MEAGSPSSRRAWIEINQLCALLENLVWSPSSRRAWIEILSAPVWLIA